MIKACWSDNTMLPGTCVLDSGDEGEIYGCVHAQDIQHHDECEHWNEELAVELCKEILGEEAFWVWLDKRFSTPEKK